MILKPFHLSSTLFSLPTPPVSHVIRSETFSSPTVHASQQTLLLLSHFCVLSLCSFCSLPSLSSQMRPHKRRFASDVRL